MQQSNRGRSNPASFLLIDQRNFRNPDLVNSEHGQPIAFGAIGDVDSREAEED